MPSHRILFKIITYKNGILIKPNLSSNLTFTIPVEMALKGEKKKHEKILFINFNPYVLIYGLNQINNFLLSYN